jgi:hypothetical protein
LWRSGVQIAALLFPVFFRWRLSAVRLPRFPAKGFFEANNDI